MGGGRVPGHLRVGEGSSGVTANRRSPVAGATPPPSYKVFKQKVRDRQVLHLQQRKGRAFIPPVSDGELDLIDGGPHRMRTAAAKRCGELLFAARSALAEKQAAGDALAKQTTLIAVHSAYRPFSEDELSWSQTFDKEYKLMLKNVAYKSEPFGRAAEDYMFDIMRPLKAPPGYSNHSNGTAVDFKTVHGGVEYKSRKVQRAAWRQTWLWPWLKRHAQDFDFKELKSEEWHWDYAPKP